MLGIAVEWMTSYQPQKCRAKKKKVQGRCDDGKISQNKKMQNESTEYHDIDQAEVEFWLYLEG